MRTAPTSRQLLAEFAQHRSDMVFRTIVSRHIDLVHSTALRRVNGDSQLAQDVCQEVFALLASKAKRLAKIESVEGWLYRQTCRRAANTVRSEQRRRRRENSAMQLEQLEAMNASQNADSIWTQLAPELETAMLKIPAKDRQAVLLRFFEGLEHCKVAEAIGATEEAARKRVTRALEKLRVQLARQGVAIPATALSAALLANAVAPAPAQATAAIVLAPGPVAQSAIVLFMKSFLTGACVAGCAVLVAQSVWPDQRTRRTPLASPSAPTSSTSIPPDVPSNSPMRALPDNPSLEWLIREMRLTLAGPQHALARLKRSQLTEAIPRDQMQTFIELGAQSLTIEEQAALLPTVFAQWNKYAPASVFAFLLKSDIDTGINKFSSTHLSTTSSATGRSQIWARHGNG